MFPWIDMNIKRGWSGRDQHEGEGRKETVVRDEEDGTMLHTHTHTHTHMCMYVYTKTA
jgi:hypothetical protein